MEYHPKSFKCSVTAVWEPQILTSTFSRMTAWHEINYTAPACMHVQMHIQRAFQLHIILYALSQDRLLLSSGLNTEPSKYEVTAPVKANPLFRSHILACRVHTETAEQQPSILEYDVNLATAATFPGIQQVKVKTFIGHVGLLLQLILTSSGNILHTA